MLVPNVVGVVHKQVGESVGKLSRVRNQLHTVEERPLAHAYGKLRLHFTMVFH